MKTKLINFFRPTRQGMVGLPRFGRAKSTTLTWLVNIDFGGFVPAALASEGTRGTMYCESSFTRETRFRHRLTQLVLDRQRQASRRYDSGAQR